MNRKYQKIINQIFPFIDNQYIMKFIEAQEVLQYNNNSYLNLPNIVILLCKHYYGRLSYFSEKRTTNKKAFLSSLANFLKLSRCASFF